MEKEELYPEEDKDRNENMSRMRRGVHEGNTTQSQSRQILQQEMSGSMVGNYVRIREQIFLGRKEGTRNGWHD